jgi:hypothetical protein
MPGELRAFDARRWTEEEWLRARAAWGDEHGIDPVELLRDAVAMKRRWS